MDYKESRWFKVINGEFGLAAIVVSLIFFIVLMLIYIARIRKEPRKMLSFFTDDRRSTPTKILRITVFLILAAGFVVVVYYNINKMATGDPIITTKVEENTLSPSILFCVPDPYYVEVKNASYLDIDRSLNVDLTESFNNFTFINSIGELNCQLFNETLTKKPKENVGGYYQFGVYSSANGTLILMGDFNDNDINRTIPQGDVHNSIGVQMAIGILNTYTYTETRYIDLNGGKIHRGFQLSVIFDDSIPAVQGKLFIEILAPPNVIINSEDPPLDLVTFFGNFGGYLIICSIFGFLFGNGKMSPFGFVTDYCFPTKDRESLMKILDNYGNNSEKLNAGTESITLFTEYYIDMEIFA